MMTMQGSSFPHRHLLSCSRSPESGRCLVMKLDGDELSITPEIYTTDLPAMLVSTFY